MMHWIFKRRAPAPEPSCQAILDGSPALDLARFDTFSPDEVAALPGRLRRLVVADRKRRVTAALVRVAAGAPRTWE